MLKKSFLSGFIILIFSLVSVQACVFAASPQQTIITVDNADEVEQVAVFYHSGIQQIGWGDNGESFFVTDANAIWLRNATTTNEPARELHGHARLTANSVTSADEAYRALLRRNNDIQVWEMQDNRLVATLQGHTDTINQIAFNPINTELASVSDDGTIRVWDVVTGQEIFRSKAHNAPVLYVSYNQAGTQLATASVDGTLRIWDAQNGQAVSVLVGHEGAVNYASYAPDGNLIASAGADGTIRIWDVLSFTEIKILDNHSASVTSLSFSPNGAYLLSGSNDHTARLWAVAQ